MIKIQRSALLTHSAERMFELVNDVESYPQFMDGCKAVELISRSEDELRARLTLSRAKVTQSFTTRNVLDKPHTMTMNLEEGPFSHFKGIWAFKPLHENACKVSLDLEFEVNNRVVAKAVEQLFKSVGDELVDAVCRRANQSNVG